MPKIHIDTTLSGIIRSVMYPSVVRLFGLLQSFLIRPVFEASEVDLTKQYIIVANHVSVLDPLLIASLFPGRIAFLANSGLFKNPILRAFFGSIHAIPVNRNVVSPRPLLTAVKYARRGMSVGVFFEGGINLLYRKDRETILQRSSLRHGAAFLAMKCQLPILPILLENADLVYTRPNKTLFGSTVRVIVGQPIGPVPRHGDPRELTREIADEIYRQHSVIGEAANDAKDFDVRERFMLDSRRTA